MADEITPLPTGHDTAEPLSANQTPEIENICRAPFLPRSEYLRQESKPTVTAAEGVLRRLDELLQSSHIVVGDARTTKLAACEFLQRLHQVESAFSLLDSLEGIVQTARAAVSQLELHVEQTERNHGPEKLARMPKMLTTLVCIQFFATYFNLLG